jgi:hypothetical protein
MNAKRISSKNNVFIKEDVQNEEGFSNIGYVSSGNISFFSITQGRHLDLLNEKQDSTKISLNIIRRQC